MKIQPTELTVDNIRSYDFYRGTNKKKDRLVFARYGTVQSLINSSNDNLMKIGYLVCSGKCGICNVYIWGDHLLIVGCVCLKGLNIRELDDATCKRIDNKFIDR